APFLESEQDLMLTIRKRLATAVPDSAADDDRRGLWMFYAGRSQPMWVTKGGWTPAAQSVIDEIERAGDWGLDADEFELPTLAEPLAAGRLTDEQIADAEVGLSLAVLKYARQARGGR